MSQSAAYLFTPLVADAPERMVLNIILCALRQDGTLPIPIYNAIQHSVKDPEKLKSLEKARTQTDKYLSKAEQEEKAKEKDAEQRKSSYVWFEMTPFEVRVRLSVR